MKREPMPIAEYQEHMRALRIDRDELAQLMNVNERTVRRWEQGKDGVPYLVGAVLKAWRRLDDLHLAWKPGAISIRLTTEGFVKV